MTVRPLAFLLVLALGAGTACLSACGSSGSDRALISPAAAGPLRGDLDAVATAIADRDCAAAAAAVQRAQDHVDSLPSSTSEQLRARLRDGLQALRRQAAEECLPPVDTTTETTPTDTVPTDTLPTDTLPTDTLPTDTVPTDTLPTDTVPVPTPNPGGTGGEDDQGLGGA